MIVYDIIIYHASCSDGMCAAWIYNIWYEEMKKTNFFMKKKKPFFYAMYHGTQEDKKSKLPVITNNKNVLILDFSFSLETILYIKSKCNNFLLLDHHKSAYEELKNEKDCLFDLSKSGCVMAWNYFFPETRIPPFIKYIEDRDLYIFKYPETKAFSRTLFLHGFSFKEFDTLLEFSDDDYEEYINIGKILLQADERHISSFVRSSKKCIFLNQYVVYVVTNKMFRSEVGDRLCDEKTDCDFILCIEYSVVENNWSFSLKSKEGKMDVEKIASAYGGGGHTYASKILFNGSDLTGILKAF